MDKEINPLLKEIERCELHSKAELEEALQFIADSRTDAIMINTNYYSLEAILDFTERLKSNAKNAPEIVLLADRYNEHLAVVIDSVKPTYVYTDGFSIEQLKATMHLVLIRQEKVVEIKNTELSKLTKTELQIAAQIASGKTTIQIAESMVVSPKTVENHRYNMCKKLGLTGSKNSLLVFITKNKDLFKC